MIVGVVRPVKDLGVLGFGECEYGGSCWPSFRPSFDRWMQLVTTLGFSLSG